MGQEAKIPVSVVDVMKAKDNNDGLIMCPFVYDYVVAAGEDAGKERAFIWPIEIR